MSKQDYEDKLKMLLTKYPCISEYYQKLADLNDEYIAYLEQENTKLYFLNNQNVDIALKQQSRIHELEEENTKLNKALEKAIDKVVNGGFCPPGGTCVTHKYGNIYNCHVCWREYLMGDK